MDFRGNIEQVDGINVRQASPRRRRRRLMRVITAYLCSRILVTNGDRTPKHTSDLTGDKWMKEMWTENESRFQEQFRMRKSAMAGLIHVLQNSYGFTPFTRVDVDQSVGMFLQILGHGLTFPLVTERFQHSGDTVSCHFHEIFKAVCLLGDDIISPLDPHFKDIHPHIGNNKKYRDAFSGCIGAIDGCHITLRLGEVDVVPWRNRKGVTSTNCLAVVDFDMCFIHATVGSEGSMHDSRMLFHALRECRPPFPFPPEGKYYLAYAGFPNIKGFLIPYRKTRYHLPDFRQAGVVRGRDENFNYLHSSLRSVVERTFGVWKAKWKILENMTRFPHEVQLKIVWATMALHNYIRRHDPDDEYMLYGNTIDIDGDTSMDDEDLCPWNAVQAGESIEMNRLRDHIRDSMQMQQIL